MQVQMSTQKDSRQGRFNNGEPPFVGILPSCGRRKWRFKPKSNRNRGGPHGCSGGIHKMSHLVSRPRTHDQTHRRPFGRFGTFWEDPSLPHAGCAVLRTNRSSQYPEGRPGRPFQRAGLACSGLRPGSLRLRRGLHRTAAPHGLRRAVTKHNSRHQTALANKLRSARCFICEHHQSNNTHPPRQLGAETLTSLRSAAPKTMVVTATAWSSSMPHQQRPSSR